MFILHTLLPIFLIIATGVILCRSRFLPATFFEQNNKLVYWIGLPCLLFAKVSTISVPGQAALRVIGVLILGIVITLIVAYIVSWILHLPMAKRGTFVQGSFRGNLAYIGLPIIFFALPQKFSTTQPQIEAIAVVALAVMTLCFNLLSIIVLLRSAEKIKNANRKQRIIRLLKDLITNPLIIACLIGLGFSLLSLSPPLFFKRFCDTTGQIALPLALLSIGASLKFRKLTRQWSSTLVASLIKGVISPLIGLYLASHLGLVPVEKTLALIFMACPTAIASYVMAEQLGGDKDLAANIILLSTLISFPVLAVMILI